MARANAEEANFGLLSWKSTKVRKQDILIAKNYLTEDEVDTLNRLVVIFLETAELRAKSRVETPMAFWQARVGSIMTDNGFPLLENAGLISQQQMEQQTRERYDAFDQRRKREEALATDKADEAELQALEDKLKQRPQD